MSRRAALALAAALAALAAAPARAAEPQALQRSAGTPADVALADDEVLVTQEISTARVTALTAAGARRTLYERTSDDVQLSLGLGASSSHAAVAFALARRGAVAAPAVFAGPLAGPLQRPVDVPRAYALDVAGDTLVTVEPPAGDPTAAPSRLLTRTLGPLGTTRALVEGRRLTPVVRAAGPYVAYAELAGGRNVAVVVDRRTGEETSRVVLSGALEGLDVQADGKLALATTRSRRETSISWTAPRRPGVREVARGARRTGVRIAADRIAYVRPVGIARELAVSDLDGFAAPASFPVAEIAAFDFDGARLAFATGTCTYLERVPGLTVRAAPPTGGPCPRSEARLRVPRRAALSPRRRALRVVAGCPMATAAGCRVAITLSVARRGVPTTLVSRQVRIPRGAERAVDLRPSLDALRRRDRGPVNVAIRHLDRPAAATSQHLVTLTSPRRDPPRPPRPPRPADEENGGEFVIGG